MNLSRVILVVVVTTTLSNILFSLANDSSECFPACVVTAEQYEKVYVGTLKMLYYLSATDNSFNISCVFSIYYSLDKDTVSAKETDFGQRGTIPYSSNDTVILTTDGLTYQTDIDSNTVYYETASMTERGVIIIKSCTTSVIIVACKVDNCGKNVLKSARKTADDLGKVNGYHVNTVYNEDCSDSPV